MPDDMRQGVSVIGGLLFGMNFQPAGGYRLESVS